MRLICQDSQFVPLINGCEELIPKHQRNVIPKRYSAYHHRAAPHTRLRHCDFLSSRSALIYFYPDQYINRYPVRDCEHNRVDVSHLTFLYADMWYSEAVQRNHK